MEGDTIVIRIEPEPDIVFSHSPSFISSVKSGDKNYSPELWKTVVVMASKIDYSFITSIGKPNFKSVSKIINGRIISCSMVLTEKWNNKYGTDRLNMKAMARSVYRSNGLLPVNDDEDNGWILF